MVDVLQIEVKWNSEDNPRSRTNKILAFAENSLNKIASSIDKDGFAIPKNLFKKFDTDNRQKGTDFSNIQVLDSDFEDDQSSQGCITTMMNEDESPESS